ncbi:hypothetical protein [Nocardia farcinica]|uniref:hypothetical protein n=1 Tax=Nocardia farcinica TaxID=37329 RepID=UPI00245853C6|nr:hypothetical protein [Nocardia farcinica]
MTRRTPAPGSAAPAPIPWFDAEPGRLIRDRAEVAAFAPALVYVEPDHDTAQILPHGGWIGELPRWPFERPAPEGIDGLLGTVPFTVGVAYLAAYPMVPPVIYPLEPKPTLQQRTQSAWHVAPDGSLCLLRSIGAWHPEASITELLAKAAGWRVEYALMCAEVIEEMTVSGIVSDPRLDDLVTATAQTHSATNNTDDQDRADEPR